MNKAVLKSATGENYYTHEVAKLGKFDLETALVIQDVIENEMLIDSWGKSSDYQIRKAIKLAQVFIANGNSWEF
jgi:hypothetical protein